MVQKHSLWTVIRALHSAGSLNLLHFYKSFPQIFLGAFRRGFYLDRRQTAAPSPIHFSSPAGLNGFIVTYTLVISTGDKRFYRLA
jgi:hypothetical protein